MNLIFRWIRYELNPSSAYNCFNDTPTPFVYIKLHDSLNYKASLVAQQEIGESQIQLFSPFSSVTTLAVTEEKNEGGKRLGSNWL